MDRQISELMAKFCCKKPQNLQQFKHDTAPSSAWIDRWKKRWNVGQILKVGEAGGVC